MGDLSTARAMWGYFRHTPRPAMYKFQADGETLNSGDGPDKYFCTVIPVD